VKTIPQHLRESRFKHCPACCERLKHTDGWWYCGNEKCNLYLPRSFIEGIGWREVYEAYDKFIEKLQKNGDVEE